MADPRPLARRNAARALGRIHAPAEPASARETDHEFFWRIVAEQDLIAAQRLAASRDDAERRGKEPFDLAVLESMADTSHGGHDIPVERWHEEYEYMYYVSYPQVMTLAEFALKVQELNRWE